MTYGSGYEYRKAREAQLQREAERAKERAKLYTIKLQEKEVEMVLDALGVKMIAFAKTEDARDCLGYSDLYRAIQFQCEAQRQKEEKA